MSIRWINELRFFFWNVRLAFKKKPKSADHLNKALCQEWVKILQRHFLAVRNGFLDRLKAIIWAKNSQIKPKLIDFHKFSIIFDNFHSTLVELKK